MSVSVGVSVGEGRDVASVVAVSKTAEGIRVRLLGHGPAPFDWVEGLVTTASVVAGRDGEPLLDAVKARKVNTVSDAAFGKACKHLLDLIVAQRVQLPGDEVVVDAFAEARITKRRSIFGPDRFSWRAVDGVDQGPLVAATVALAALDEAKPVFVGMAWGYRDGRKPEIVIVESK